MKKIAAHSVYDMFSWYKYLIVCLVFSHLGFWSWNLFLIAPFPDLCLLVPFQMNAMAMYYDPIVKYKNKHVRAFGCRDTSNFVV